MPKRLPARPGRLVAASFAVAFALSAAAAASAYHTHFVANVCNHDFPAAALYISRENSAAYALVGRYEGYQWGGGCWNDNNVDDSPGDPTQDPNTGGEGGDCSGFTFKVWRESPYTWDDAGWDWDKKTVVHGPFDAAAFKVGSGAANWALSKYKAIRMDAFASTSHIGIIWAKNADGGAVSAETAAAMASGARARLQADVAIAVTGIAGPSGGTPEKPVGLVFLHAETPDASRGVEFNFPGDRESTRQRATVAALHLARRVLSQTGDERV